MNAHNKPTTSPVSGIMPVMLTLFTAEDQIDYPGLERLTEWYLDAGVHSLFAVCQSSEMQRLSLEECVSLVREVVRFANGRVPVVASGHVSETVADQIEKLRAMAAIGADALVLVTNRLDPQNNGFDTFRANLEVLLEALPSDMDLGLYECPAPYRRLLDDELKQCRDAGRFGWGHGCLLGRSAHNQIRVGSHLFHEGAHMRRRIGGTLVLIAADAPGRHRDQLDILGAVTVTASIVAVVAAFTYTLEAGFPDPIASGFLVSGIALIAVFIIVEGRSANPLRCVRDSLLSGLTRGMIEAGGEAWRPMRSRGPSSAVGG